MTVKNILQELARWWKNKKRNETKINFYQNDGDIDLMGWRAPNFHTKSVKLKVKLWHWLVWLLVELDHWCLLIMCLPKAGPEVYRSIRSSQIQLNAKLKRQHSSGEMDYQNILQKQLKVGYSSITMSECRKPNRWPCTASSGRKYKVGRCPWILDPRIFF